MQIALSPREKQLIERFAIRGESNKELAAALGCSIHTIHTYMRSARAKLNVSNRTELLVKVKFGK